MKAASRNGLPTTSSFSRINGGKRGSVPERSRATSPDIASPAFVSLTAINARMREIAAESNTAARPRLVELLAEARKLCRRAEGLAAEVCGVPVGGEMRGFA